MIIGSNLTFFAYWAIKMIVEARNKMQKCYLFFCLCGNRERLEREILNRKVQDENDVLRDEFLNCNPCYVAL